MQGIIKDITIDGSICIISIDDIDTGKTSIVNAETRLFLSAIDDCYGDEWRNQTIEYDLDSIGCMIGFSPLD